MIGLPSTQSVRKITSLSQRSSPDQDDSYNGLTLSVDFGGLTIVLADALVGEVAHVVVDRVLAEWLTSPDSAIRNTITRSIVVTIRSRNSLLS